MGEGFRRARRSRDDAAAVRTAGPDRRIQAVPHRRATPPCVRYGTTPWRYVRVVPYLIFERG